MFESRTDVQEGTNWWDATNKVAAEQVSASEWLIDTMSLSPPWQIQPGSKYKWFVDGVAQVSGCSVNKWGDTLVGDAFSGEQVDFMQISRDWESAPCESNCDAYGQRRWCA